MADTAAAAEADITDLVASVEQVGDGLVAGVYARVAALRDLPAETEKSPCLVCGRRNLTPAAVPAGRADCRHRPGRVCPGQSLAQADACLGGRLARILRAGDSSRRGIGGRLHRRAAARRLRALPLRTLRLWTVVAVVGPIIVAAVRSLFMASRPNRVPGTLRPYDGAGARPLARHRRGDRRRYAARDIAALEHRAGTGGSAANRFGHPDLPPVCLGGMAAQTHNGRRRRRSAPERPLADPPCQSVAGNRDRFPGHHVSQHPDRADLGRSAARRGRAADCD